MAARIFSIDPVAALALQAAEAAQELHRAEVGPGVSSPQAENAVDRLTAIEEMASHVRATTLLGAFYQALLLASATDPEEGWITSGVKTEVRKLHRMAESIVGALAGQVAPAQLEQLSYYH